MKFQTKFTSGDKVLTPISERIGTINCVIIRNKGERFDTIYDVAIDMPYIKTNSYKTISAHFYEFELTAVE